jgi:hypothetical protein
MIFFVQYPFWLIQKLLSDNFCMFGFFIKYHTVLAAYVVIGNKEARFLLNTNFPSTKPSLNSALNPITPNGC